MRLRRLDLARYGKFTDTKIDFGEPAEGQPDLHIVYGPNEAGKSTALSAVLDLLFGIESRSPYNFMHPYPTMRIGATLELGGEMREFVRIKRPQNSLLDGHDQLIAETAILADLGGIDRDAYRSMFSLDDETLEAGGESILASKGDLGQLLFSASAGLADLSRSLGDLKLEAERFYRFKAHKGDLPELKKRLAELKAQRAEIDTLASDYAGLIEASDRAGGQYDATIATRGFVQTRIEEIGRHLNAWPRLAALRAIEQRLLPFADLPDVPPSWAQDLPQLQTEEIRLAVETGAVLDDIERLTATLGAIRVDAEALRQSDGIRRIAALRARHVTADKDLPERRLQLRDAEATVAGLLRRIDRGGESEPRRLLLGASLGGRLRELIEARSGIEAGLKAAHAELLSAQRRLGDAQARLGSAGGSAVERGPPAALSSLAATVAVLRSDDHAARRRLAERARETAAAALADCLRELRPWRGEAAGLAELALPGSDAVARWTDRMAEARQRLERHAGELERLATERARLEAERDAIGATSGIVTDREAAAIRAERERAWAAHRQRLDSASAERFEEALRHDDTVARERFGHVAEVARLAQVSQALAVALAEGARAADLRTAAASAQRAVEDEVAAALRSGAPMLEGLGLPELASWLGRRERALEHWAHVRSAERDVREAAADGIAACTRLAAALTDAGSAAGPEAGAEALLGLAQGVLDRESELAALRVSVEERQREAETRQRDADTAEEAERAWAAGWAETCAASWLAEHGAAPPALATVREILPVLADLGPALDKTDGLADRIDKMEKDQAAFGEVVARLAADLGLGPGPVLDMAQAIDDRLETARADRARRETETRKLEAAGERRHALAAALDIHRGRAAHMTAVFGVEALADVARKLGEAERRDDLRRQAAEAEREILEALRLATLTEAESALDAADRAALETELAGLKTRFDDLDQRCRDLFVTLNQARDRVEAVGGDSRVAEIEERRRTVLLEIEAGALRYLRLRAGTAATEQALRAYRDQHRSSMMDRASQAFRTISRGAYAGLSAQPEKDGEALIALPAGGGSKLAAELSKGTRFQLYLALRVAGYYEFARSRPPVPFIADDIMETFDDFRAEEAFRLFAGMAGVGQIIYLTHHLHLCDMVRAVCPGARIHELPGGTR